MKRVIITIMALSTAFAASAQTDRNPLLEDFKTFDGTIPFNEIRLEHYMPAFRIAVDAARAEVDAVINNPEVPTFENTIEALEFSGRQLERISTIFFVLNNTETSDEMEQIAAEVMPLLTDFSNDISLNPALFERVSKVWEQRENLVLDKEQYRLLEKSYKGFSRSGAALSDSDKEKYRAISTELSLLALKFSQNILGATNEFSLNIPASDISRVDYMPEFVKAGMAAEARQRGEEGWTVTLQAPSYIPFMTYSRERDLKETIWKAYNSRSYQAGDYDNREIVKRIAELRLSMANLLGYDTYADFVLEERMAKSTETVNRFLDELLVNTFDWALEDFNAVSNFASGEPGAPAVLMPWDFGYYDEQYKNAKYSLNEELIKPYFQLENVERGVFDLFEKLYGVTFRENNDIQVYNPEVKAFEVCDKDGSYLAVLYMDYFPRASKRDGAWMTNFRDMYTTPDGTVYRPHVTLNYNFTKPTQEEPSLLTFDEVVVFLHEFGHGMHGIFAQGRYPSLTGTGVYRDFVELPSQLMENWATEKEFLDMWAVHYQTGEKMPEELIRKLEEAKNYQEAYMNVRQVAYAMNDMAWYTITEPVTMDPGEFEKQAMSRAQILPVVEGTCMSTAFSHIFAGGYAAGYYSYKWAEVLEADAFSIFKKNGIFDRNTAESFRENILSKGGTEHPMTLYINFSGHEPQTSALIEKIGQDHK